MPEVKQLQYRDLNGEYFSVFNALSTMIVDFRSPSVGPSLPHLPAYHFFAPFNKTYTRVLFACPGIHSQLSRHLTDCRLNQNPDAAQISISKKAKP
jgi:hypothetical protein